MTATATTTATPATSRTEVAIPSKAGMPDFPDVDRFTEADVREYRTYSSYATTGLQFVTPGGYRCLMWANRRATYSGVRCWGALPQRGFNSVWAGGGAASFGNADLSRPETTYVYPGGPTGTVSPDAYKPLPSGMKLVEESVFPMQCVVRDQLTACRAKGFGAEPTQTTTHGFVLSPNGSWTF